MTVKKRCWSAAVFLLAMLVMITAVPNIACGEVTLTVSPQTLKTGYANNTRIIITSSDTAFDLTEVPVIDLTYNSANYIVNGSATVNSVTEIACQVKSGLPAGNYTMYVTPMGGGTVYQATLTVADPVITSITPNNIPYGYAQAIPVTLAGQNTSFTKSGTPTTVALFNAGNPVIGAVSGVDVMDVNNLTFNLASKPGGTDIPAGTYTVRATTGTEIVNKEISVYTPSIGIAPVKLPVGYTNGQIAVTNNVTEFQTNSSAQLLNAADSSVVTGGVTSVAVNASDKTRATVTLKPSLAAGNYIIRMTSAYEITTAPFEVYQAAIALSVNQQQVNTIATINVTGTKTNFVQGTTRVYLYDSVNPNPVRTIDPTVTSASSLSFSLNTSGLTAGNYTIQTVTGDEKATASYTLTAEPIINYNVTVTVDPAETGTVTGAGTYAAGTDVTLTAVPASGYQFVRWVEGVTILGTNSTYTLTNLQSNKSIRAEFSLITYNVTFNVKNESDQNVAGAAITLAGYTNRTTNDLGTAVFTGVAPAQNIAYTVTKDGYQQASGTVNVTNSNITKLVTLAERPSVTVKGYASWLKADDDSGITVTAKQGAVTIASTTTDINGLFELGLSSGTYTVELSKDGYIKTTIGNVEVDAIGTLVELSTAANKIVLVAGDANADLRVDLIDLGMLANAYGSSSPAPGYSVLVDFNGDLNVDLIDLGILANSYGYISPDIDD